MLENLKCGAPGQPKGGLHCEYPSIPLGGQEKEAPGRGTVSTFLWAQKEATLLNLKSPGEGEG